MTSQWIMAVFILEAVLSIWMNLGKHPLLVWLFISSVKMVTRCIICLDLNDLQQKIICLTDNVSCAHLHTRDTLPDE